MTRVELDLTTCVERTSRSCVEEALATKTKMANDASILKCSAPVWLPPVTLLRQSVGGKVRVDVQSMGCW